MSALIDFIQAFFIVLSAQNSQMGMLILRSRNSGRSHPIFGHQRKFSKTGSRTQSDDFFENLILVSQIDFGNDFFMQLYLVLKLLYANLDFPLFVSNSPK